MELSECTHEPVSKDEGFVLNSAGSRHHAQSVVALAPVSNRLALRFGSSLFSSAEADDSRARRRARISLILIGANPDIEFDSAHASDAEARSPNGVQP